MARHPGHDGDIRGVSPGTKALLQRLPNRQQLRHRSADHEQKRDDDHEYGERTRDQSAHGPAVGLPCDLLMQRMKENGQHHRPGNHRQERLQHQRT